MLINVPSADGMDEVALRLHFDAWERTIKLIDDFADVFHIDFTEVSGDHPYKNEWIEYVGQAQAEMGALCANIQQAAELRLKSIICGTSPFLLLLNGGVSLKASKQNDIDFTEQRTLDAVDLPNAVRTLTKFELPDSYVEQYGIMRRLRNEVTHLGSHGGGLSPHKIIKLLIQQYLSLWQDGRWLYRRVRFDGNSASRFFYDQRWSSVESDVMAELPYTMSLFDNRTFKKAIGVAKGKLKGFCPHCMWARATKWDEDGHATAYQTDSTSARCAMCERILRLQTLRNGCNDCGSTTYVEKTDEFDALCFSCGCGGHYKVFSIKSVS